LCVSVCACLLPRGNPKIKGKGKRIVCNFQSARMYFLGKGKTKGREAGTETTHLFIIVITGNIGVCVRYRESD